MTSSIESKIEKWYPITGGVIATCLYYSISKNSALPNLIKDIFSAGATLSSIATGFLATAISIILTITNSDIVKLLKSMRVYVKLINYFMEAIRWSFLVVIFSLIGLFIDFSTNQSWHLFLFNSFNLKIHWQLLFFNIWIFFLITSLLCTYRVVNIFAIILKSL